MRIALALLLAATACASQKARKDADPGDPSTNQDELAAKVEALEAQQRAMATDIDQLTIELRRTRSVAEDLVTRMAELEAPKRPAQAKAQPGKPDPAVTYKVLVGDAHVRGPDTALVTIVEWADFQCPFCARVRVTLEDLEAKYKGRVRFVFKHNPLPMHQRAMAAALAAEAAGRQGKFWQMHDLLFSDTRNLSDEQFLTYAKKLKLDRRRFKRDLADASLKAKIDEHQKQGNTLGARGTPAFFVNGRFLSGAQPVESFSALIDEEMARAQARVDNGTRATEVYEAIMAEAMPASF